MGLVHYGIPPLLVQLATRECGVRTFVESGTFLGETTAYAASHFQRLYTIEFATERFQNAVRRFASQSHVTCLQGNSPDVIRKIAPELKGIPTLFWLDAHWVADGESREFECPLADEVRVINDAHLDAFILVDDARYFMSPPPPPHDPNNWPSLAQLISLLANDNQRFVIILDDVIAAWPMAMRSQLTVYAQQRQAAIMKAHNAPTSQGPVFSFVQKT